MATPVVQSQGAVAGGGVTGGNVSLTGVASGATLLLVLAQSPTSSGVTPVITASSNASGAFTSDVAFFSADSTSFNNGIAFLSLASAAAGAHTVTWSSTQSLDGISLFLLELPSGYTFDPAGTNPATNKALTTTTVTTSGYTPSRAALVFAAAQEAGLDVAAGLSHPPAGWTAQDQQQNGSTTAQFAPLVISLKNATTGAQSATWTWTSSRTGYGVLAGYLPALAGGSTASLMGQACL
jgi:hypothetical protein